MKKLGALLVVCLFFSGTGYDNQATIIPSIPTVDHRQHPNHIQEMNEKSLELDSLLIELKKYENRK